MLARASSCASFHTCWSFALSRKVEKYNFIVVVVGLVLSTFFFRVSGSMLRVEFFVLLHSKPGTRSSCCFVHAKEAAEFQFRAITTPPSFAAHLTLNWNPNCFVSWRVQRRLIRRRRRRSLTSPAHSRPFCTKCSVITFHAHDDDRN